MINRYYLSSDFEYEKLTSPLPASNSLVKLVSEAIESKLLGKDVLEIGCGTGGLSSTIESYGLSYTGVDVSKSAINIAKSSFPSSTFFECDFLHWDDPKRYDLIIDGHTFHCLVEDDRKKYLAEVLKQLKSGGQFVLESMILSKRMMFPESYSFEKNVLAKEVSSSKYPGSYDRDGRTFIPYRTIVDNYTLEKELLSSGLIIKKLFVPYGAKLAIDDIPVEHCPDVMRVICEAP